MNWSKYLEKKGKTADFVKKEKVISKAKKEIKDKDGAVIQVAKAEEKKSYIAYVCKCWNSETGEAMADSEREYSLVELENEKKRWDDECARAKAQSDGLALAIEDFKKL